MTLEESKILAVAAIHLVSNDTKNSEQIKVCQIKSDTKRFEVIDKKSGCRIVTICNRKISY